MSPIKISIFTQFWLNIPSFSLVSKFADIICLATGLTGLLTGHQIHRIHQIHRSHRSHRSHSKSFEVIKVAIKIWATKVWATKVGVNYISSFLRLIVVIKVQNRNFSKTCLSLGLLQYDLFLVFPDNRPEINGNSYQKQ